MGSNVVLEWHIIYQIGMNSPVEGQNGKNILSAFKKCIKINIVPTTLQTDNGTEFENNIMNQFWLERNIKYIFGTSYSFKHQSAVESLTEQLKILLTLSKDHQKEWYSLNDSIYNFVLSDVYPSGTRVCSNLASLFW